MNENDCILSMLAEPVRNELLPVLDEAFSDSLERKAVSADKYFQQGYMAGTDIFDMVRQRVEANLRSQHIQSFTRSKEPALVLKLKGFNYRLRIYRVQANDDGGFGLPDRPNSSWVKEYEKHALQGRLKGVNSPLMSVSLIYMTDDVDGVHSAQLAFLGTINGTRPASYGATLVLRRREFPLEESTAASAVANPRPQLTLLRREILPKEDDNEA